MSERYKVCPGSRTEVTCDGVLVAVFNGPEHERSAKIFAKVMNIDEIAEVIDSKKGLKLGFKS